MRNDPVEVFLLLMKQRNVVALKKPYCLCEAISAEAISLLPRGIASQTPWFLWRRRLAMTP